MRLINLFFFGIFTALILGASFVSANSSLQAELTSLQSEEAKLLETNKMLKAKVKEIKEEIAKKKKGIIAGLVVGGVGGLVGAGGLIYARGKNNQIDDMNKQIDDFKNRKERYKDKVEKMKGKEAKLVVGLPSDYLKLDVTGYDWAPENEESVDEQLIILEDIEETIDLWEELVEKALAEADLCDNSKGFSKAKIKELEPKATKTIEQYKEIKQKLTEAKDFYDTNPMKLEVTVMKAGGGPVGAGALVEIDSRKTGVDKDKKTDKDGVVIYKACNPNPKGKITASKTDEGSITLLDVEKIKDYKNGAIEITLVKVALKAKKPKKTNEFKVFVKDSGTKKLIKTPKATVVIDEVKQETSKGIATFKAGTVGNGKTITVTAEGYTQVSTVVTTGEDKITTADVFLEKVSGGGSDERARLIKEIFKIGKLFPKKTKIKNVLIGDEPVLQKQTVKKLTKILGLILIVEVTAKKGGEKLSAIVASDNKDSEIEKGEGADANITYIINYKAWDKLTVKLDSYTTVSKKISDFGVNTDNTIEIELEEAVETNFKKGLTVKVKKSNGDPANKVEVTIDKRASRKTDRKGIVIFPSSDGILFTDKISVVYTPKSGIREEFPATVINSIDNFDKGSIEIKLEQIKKEKFDVTVMEAGTDEHGGLIKDADVAINGVKNPVKTTDQGLASFSVNTVPNNQPITVTPPNEHYEENTEEKTGDKTVTDKKVFLELTTDGKQAKDEAIKYIVKNKGWINISKLGIALGITNLDLGGLDEVELKKHIIKYVLKIEEEMQAQKTSWEKKDLTITIVHQNTNGDVINTAIPNLKVSIGSNDTTITDGKVFTIKHEKSEGILAINTDKYEYVPKTGQPAKLNMNTNKFPGFEEFDKNITIILKKKKEEEKSAIVNFVISSKKGPLEGATITISPGFIVDPKKGEQETDNDGKAQFELKHGTGRATAIITKAGYEKETVTLDVNTAGVTQNVSISLFLTKTIEEWKDNFKGWIRVNMPIVTEGNEALKYQSQTLKDIDYSNYDYTALSNLVIYMQGAFIEKFLSVYTSYDLIVMYSGSLKKLKETAEISTKSQIATNGTGTKLVEIYNYYVNEKAGFPQEAEEKRNKEREEALDKVIKLQEDTGQDMIEIATGIITPPGKWMQTSKANLERIEKKMLGRIESIKKQISRLMFKYQEAAKGDSESCKDLNICKNATGLGDIKNEEILEELLKQWKTFGIKYITIVNLILTQLENIKNIHSTDAQSKIKYGKATDKLTMKTTVGELKAKLEKSKFVFGTDALETLLKKTDIVTTLTKDIEINFSYDALYFYIYSYGKVLISSPPEVWIDIDG